jgi:hypothetical protein
MKRHNTGPQDLVTVSLCIQIAINKMQLCSLSVANTYAYQNPTATIGHSVHNVDIRKQLAHTTPYYSLSTIYPVQLKPGFIREEHTSPACQWPLKVSICPLMSFTTPNCSQVKTLVRMTRKQMRYLRDKLFPEMVSDSLCNTLFGCANPQFHQLSRWLVLYDPAVKEAGCGIPGMAC